MKKKENPNVRVAIVVKEQYDKGTVIRAIRWFFGYNQREAESYFKECGTRIHNQLAFGYLMNARKAFVED